MSTVLGQPNQLEFFIRHPSTPMSHFAKVSADDRGAVFTRSEVVDFILDLAGYTVDKPLYRFRFLEPSLGEGDFLTPAVDRLLTAYQAHHKDQSQITDQLQASFRAVEVHHESIQRAQTKLVNVFRAHGISSRAAQTLIDSWIVQEDFLLTDLPQTFTHAVGNPPYLRQEMIPDALMAEYRARYCTIYDRADLYVPFLERCLERLEPGGTLGFICSDRWMKNKYGAPLRQMVACEYHLTCYVDMVDTPAFHSDVIAYPAITMIKREKSGPTRIAHRPKIDRDTLSKLAVSLSGEFLAKGNGVIEVDGIVKGQEPWILQSFDQLAVVRRLETDFPVLEDAGCKVGIGVATGADKVFIGPYEDLNVEPDRKLPLVTTRDIAGGTVKWRGLGVINPFLDDGALVDLEDYPKLARHFEKHADVIRKRNCARKNPKGWYRTIDRIYPALARQSKLLIPDIKGAAHIVYEDGHYYPHHNLYHITSDEWDLRALQAILQSGIAKLFVSTYSTQMRGGYLRFQAQYLRRIRLPPWKEVPKGVRKALVEAAKAGDIEACNQITFDLYRLSFEERAAIMCLGK